MSFTCVCGGVCPSRVSVRVCVLHGYACVSFTGACVCPRVRRCVYFTGTCATREVQPGVSLSVVHAVQGRKLTHPDLLLAPDRLLLPHPQQLELNLLPLEPDCLLSCVCVCVRSCVCGVCV
jgi:hypothetical protein